MQFINFSCRDIEYDITQLYNMQFCIVRMLSTGDCIIVVSSSNDHSVHITVIYVTLSLDY